MFAGARKWLALAVLLGAVFPLTLVLYAHSANGFHGFPIDDAWIHLQFARNLSQHGEWTYFPGDASVSGSTSPLYTMALALGFLFTDNEKVLSHALGLLFHLGFLTALAAWAHRRLGDPLWAAAAVLLVALDGRVGILAVSGMETGLFLFAVALAFFARAAARPMLCGAALGACVWIRPDGMILVVALAIDLLLERLWIKKEVEHEHEHEHEQEQEHRPGWRRSWLAALLPLGLLLGAYGVFNLVVGGTVLPNTFAAKTAYYRVIDPWVFISGPLFKYLVANAGWIVSALALLAVGGVALRLARRRCTPLAAEAGWVVGLVLAYVLFLPFIHRFDRYLVPALPALTVLGLGAVKLLVDGALERKIIPSERLARIVSWTVLGLALALQLYSGFLRESWFAHRFYAHWCRYHNVRHERTGRWLGQNTKPGAVIATHDVGAIAFYSGRKVVDMVGLVEPEAHRYLHKPEYVTFLGRLFAKHKVTHLAALQNWIEVDNVKPIFRAFPRPEILEVFRWQQGRTHICPMMASQMKRHAMMLLKQGKLQQALNLLHKVVKSDPGSSRSWIMLGQAYESSFNANGAVLAYSRALKLNPSIPRLAAHVRMLRMRISSRK